MYELDNFYQNYYSYSTSRSYAQLHGDNVSFSDARTDCGDGSWLNVSEQTPGSTLLCVHAFAFPCQVFFGNNNNNNNNNNHSWLHGPFTLAASSSNALPCSWKNAVLISLLLFTECTNTNRFAPCGLVAHSFFNDSVSVAAPLALQETGIAWESDVDFLFRNPQDWPQFRHQTDK